MIKLVTYFLTILHKFITIADTTINYSFDIFLDGVERKYVRIRVFSLVLITYYATLFPVCVSVATFTGMYIPCACRVAIRCINLDVVIAIHHVVPSSARHREVEQVG